MRNLLHCRSGVVRVGTGEWSAQETWSERQGVLSAVPASDRPPVLSVERGRLSQDSSLKINVLERWVRTGAMRGWLKVGARPSCGGPDSVGTRAPAKRGRGHLGPPCTQVQTLGWRPGSSMYVCMYNS